MISCKSAAASHLAHVIWLLASCFWSTVIAHCHFTFVKFVRLADLYWRGKEIEEPSFGQAIADALVLPEILEHCPLARAVAHLLTAELAMWLSRPLATQLTSGLSDDLESLEKMLRYPIQISTMQREYDAEVWSYAQVQAGNAAGILEGASKYDRELVSRLGGGHFDVMLQRLLRGNGLNASADIADFLTISNEVAPSEYLAELVAAGYYLDLESMKERDWPPFSMAVLDKGWNEVWLPVLLHDAGPFWYVSQLHGVQAQNLDLLEKTQELIPRLEGALQQGFFVALNHMWAAKEAGLVDAFWPSRSTLLALMRHGRLFGIFADGHWDCVDDDLDFEVRLPNSLGSWPRFAREVARAWQGDGCKCYFGAAVASIRVVGYSQLLCLCPISEFIIPISFQHVKEESSPQRLGSCSAYGTPVPCLYDISGLIANYGGCPALPNIEFAGLTVGNKCIEWMEGGLSSSHILELRNTAKKLAGAGFVSMENVWSHVACSYVLFPEIMDTTSVGRSIGLKVRGKHRSKTSSSELQELKEAPIPKLPEAFMVQTCAGCGDCDWNLEDSYNAFTLGGGGHTAEACRTACLASSVCEHAALSDQGYCHCFATCDVPEVGANWMRWSKLQSDNY